MRREKKALRQKQTVQKLMDLGPITPEGVETSRGTLSYFLLQPVNLSVLSETDVRQQVASLTNLLLGTQELELAALDSRESFESNKLWYQTRMEEEEIPAIRDLLRRDMAHLDEIQAATATARGFAVILRRTKDGAGSPRTTLMQTEKSINDQGFHAHLASPEELKKLFAIYYEQNIATEQFEDVEGERWFRYEENETN